MAKDHYEKDFEDEVYEDGYYDEHYDEEELSEEGELIEEGEKEFLDEEEPVVVDLEDEFLEEEEWEGGEKKISVSFACEDCDYRWDDLVSKKRGELPEEEEYMDVICPMCGSMNITLI